MHIVHIVDSWVVMEDSIFLTFLNSICVSCILILNAQRFVSCDDVLIVFAHAGQFCIHIVHELVIGGLFVGIGVMGDALHSVLVRGFLTVFDYGV